MGFVNLHPDKKGWMLDLSYYLSYKDRPGSAPLLSGVVFFLRDIPIGHRPDGLFVIPEKSLMT